MQSWQILQIDEIRLSLSVSYASRVMHICCDHSALLRVQYETSANDDKNGYRIFVHCNGETKLHDSWLNCFQKQFVSQMHTSCMIIFSTIEKWWLWFTHNVLVLQIQIKLIWTERTLVLNNKIMTRNPVDLWIWNETHLF